ncbi:hypothetical protein AX16_001667, partial [Volvariella volvacea WC 439]
VIYGGEGSNYTVKRIIKESILIMIYRNSHSIFDKNFFLNKLTLAHSDPDMQFSYEKALEVLQKCGVHEYIAGRTSVYSLPDAIDIGNGMLIGLNN